MLLSNFHTHTYRCHHAKGTEREYVEAAIKAGIKTLGFSDHSPYVFENGYYSDYRMTPDEVQGYLDTVNSLKEEYKKDIDIYVGFETEYYPRFFDKFVELIKPYPIDYLIIGQHYTKNEFDGTHTFNWGNKDTRLLFDYVDQLIEGVKTGLFSYIAHPDMVICECDEKLYEEQMSRICEIAKEKNLPLECNLWGAYGNRPYPSERFFKIAAKYHNDVIFGLDAHNSEVIEKSAEISNKQRKMLERNGLNIVHKIKLLNGKIVG